MLRPRDAYNAHVARTPPCGTLSPRQTSGGKRRHPQRNEDLPAMRLHTNTASPFGRKVKVLAHETDLMDRLELANHGLSPVSPDAAVSATNPLGKIPCLVTEAGE